MYTAGGIKKSIDPGIMEINPGHISSLLGIYPKAGVRVYLHADV